jgi:hypothetical protein
VITAPHRMSSSRRSGHRVSTAIALVLLFPVVLAVVIVLVFSAAEIAGYTQFSYEPPRNLAEAAGMGIASEALRYLRDGSDPNEVVFVRPDIISSEVTRVTALEAAIWSRRVQLVRMLDREGAIADTAVRQHLACLAKDLAVADIVSYLAPAGLSQCAPGETSRSVAARSQQ